MAGAREGELANPERSPDTDSKPGGGYRGKMKTVLVTGATQGIGLHTALRLAQAGNHHVVLHGRTAESGEAAMARIRSESGARKENFSLVTGDLSDLMQVRFEEWGGQESSNLLGNWRRKL